MTENENLTEARRLGAIAALLAVKKAILGFSNQSIIDSEQLRRIDEQLQALGPIEPPDPPQQHS